MENKHIGKYIIGIIIGVVITSIICFGLSDNKREVSINGMHQMPDGTIMTNSGMDMRSMMAGMNEALAGKKGDEFDRAFIEEMIVHHEGAVDMAKLALANAKHQEIKTLANAIISAQTKEINQMKEWLKNWYN